MVEYDYQAGIDISALASVTQVQLMEMVNKQYPRYNIGGILYINGGGGTNYPDVVSNPRYVRYLWIDIYTAGSPVLKLYTGTYPTNTYGAWTTFSVPDASLTAAKLANYAVTVLNAAGNSKIAYKQDGTADNTKANYGLCLDASGQYVTVSLITDLIPAGTIVLGKLDISGITAGHLLYKNAAGVLAGIAPGSIATVEDNSLTLNKFAQLGAGNDQYLFRVENNGAGVYIPTIVPNIDRAEDLFPDNSIKISRLYDAAAADGDAIRYNGTIWVRKPRKFSTALVMPDRLTGGVVTFAHTLGALPTSMGGYIKNISGGALLGYANGDIIDISNIIQSGNGGELRNGTFLGANATDVFCTFILDGAAGAAQGYRIARKDTFALSAILVPANWEVYLWASL